MKSLTKSAILGLFISGNVMAAGAPYNFTYQGKLMNAAGTAPLASVINLRLDILDPSGKCLIYSETQTGIDLSQTNGLFAVLVGTPLADSKRTSGVDLGLAMTQVFANAGTQLVATGGTCTGGYTPTSGDGRLLHVSVTNGGATTVITPDLPINSVPNALVSETVQGLSPTDFYVPVGSVMSLVTSSCPTGYLKADGSLVNKSLYPNLFAAISNTFGTGNSTQFNLPDLRGAFLRGVDYLANGASKGIDPDGLRAVGSFQQDSFQGHRHAANYSDTSAGGGYHIQGGNGAAVSNTMVSDPISDGANGAPRTTTETRPKNVAVTYCVKY